MGDRPGIEYVVVRVNVVGNLEHWQTVYSTDGTRHRTQEAAIKHGWNVEGHDDWLLGHIRDDTLIELSWQYEDFADFADDLPDAAQQLATQLRRRGSPTTPP